MIWQHVTATDCPRCGGAGIFQCPVSRFTPTYKKELVSALQELKEKGATDTKLYRKIYPTTDAPPRFYGLPKIHKEGAPLRPIVSTVKAITYQCAKHLADLITPVVSHSRSHMRNSQHFADKMRESHVDDTEQLRSYDVKSLFTNVPVDKAIELLEKKLRQDPTLTDRTNMNPSDIAKLLTICLNCTYFVFDGQFYRQVHGAPMALEHVKAALKDCGYPEWALQDSDSTNKSQKSQHHLPMRRTAIFIPYVKGLSEELRGTLKQHGVDTIFKPYNTLRQLLSFPKDPQKQGDTCGPIYRVTCQEVDCGSSYVGETERTLKSRFAEHLRPSSASSEVSQHIHRDYPRHKVEVEVLDHEDRWIERGIKEAIYIRVHRPDLNRDTGRYLLPYIWDNLLRSRVAKSRDR